MKLFTPLILALTAIAVSASAVRAQEPSPVHGPAPALQKVPQKATQKVIFPLWTMITIPLSAAQRERAKKEYAVIMRGDEVLEAGDTGGAIAAFLEARQFGTESLIALMRLANAYRLAGRTGEAVAAYRQLIYPPPGRGWSHANRLSPPHQMNFALLLLQTGQEAEALAAYRRARLTLNYDDNGRPKIAALLPDVGPGGLPYSPRLLRAMVCLGLGVDSVDAEAPRLKEAVALAPDSAAANYYLGKYLSGSDNPGAKVALGRAVQFGDARTAQAARDCLASCRHVRGF